MGWDTPRPENCPAEWEGRTRRVILIAAAPDGIWEIVRGGWQLMESIEGGEPAGHLCAGHYRFRGWELREDIEGYARRGELWFDGNAASNEPEPSWAIEEEEG